MRKLLNKPWFVASMAVAALALAAHSVFSRGSKLRLPGFSPDENTSAADASAEESTNANSWLFVNKIVTPVATRDPFAATAKIEAAVIEQEHAPDLVDNVRLTALWTQDGHTFVLINDHICQDGDEIGRLKIESATQDGVWLSHWKGRNFIAVGGSFTLSTPADKFLRVVGSL